MIAAVFLVVLCIVVASVTYIYYRTEKHYRQ